MEQLEAVADQLAVNARPEVSAFKTDKLSEPTTADAIPTLVHTVTRPGSVLHTVTRKAPVVDKAPAQVVDLDQQGTSVPALVLPAARFYDSTRLLGLVRQAVNDNEAVEFTHVQYPSLRIYPQLQAICGESTEAVA